MASATSNSSVLTNPECCTSSDFVHCCTEVSHVPSATSEMAAVVTLQMVEWEQAEIVIGKEILIPIYSLNSELVVRYKQLTHVM